MCYVTELRSAWIGGAYKMKRSNKFKLWWRETQMVVRGLTSTKHVVLAHIIPTRKCNLACAYCNEYDDFSSPVPTDEMIRRIDRLAYLKTSIVTISGGEPLLHPEIEKIIQRIRHHGMLAGMITNGYLLTPKKIIALNEAGLEHLQISIDNIQPDDVSLKSLKVLDKKLEYLADFAEFAVNINSVIGGGIRNPEDAELITNRAIQLGFSSSLGIIHDGGGAVKPLNRREERVFREIRNYGKHSYSRLNWFQHNLARGIPNDWRCRAGARYLARTAWSITVHSSAAIPQFRSKNTPSLIWSANTFPRRRALRPALWAACKRSPLSITGAIHRSTKPTSDLTPRNYTKSPRTGAEPTRCSRGPRIANNGGMSSPLAPATMTISCFAATEAQIQSISEGVKRAGLYDRYKEQVYGEHIMITVQTRTFNERETVKTILRQAGIAEYIYEEENAA